MIFLVTMLSPIYARSARCNEHIQARTLGCNAYTGQPILFPNNTSQPVNVSIVPGASNMADRAFSPNPVSITDGEIIRWINNDTTFHTVTSGKPNDPLKGFWDFDSGLSGPIALTTKGKMFKHVFSGMGEFPYFCQLHPTMVGKVMICSV
jgi:plastocyanin